MRTISPKHGSGGAVPALTRELRVASVPSAHVYVRHLQPPAAVTGAPRVVRLPDPDPDDPGRSTFSTWWPPVMLDPAWVRAASGFDIFHLHFGFDARPPQDLQALVEALREKGTPLVYTVHDLRNPHHRSRRDHDAQLDVLIPAADALITLTPGAAAQIEQRWGRSATVLPHPHVVDLRTMERLRRQAALTRQGRPFRVGLHVKSLRASMDPVAILPGLLRAVAQIPGAVLQVNGHTDVLDPHGEHHDPVLAAALRDAGDTIDVRMHDFLSDEELWDYLCSLDVSVLPYRFGTHSGWQEACHDLGTAVVAPSCGFYAEQGPVHQYRLDEDEYDEDSLVDAVLEAHRQRPAAGVTVEHRLEQRSTIARAHADLYASLVG